MELDRVELGKKLCSCVESRFVVVVVVVVVAGALQGR